MKYNNRLERNGYSREEELAIYNNQLTEVIQFTRWYLDNFEFMQEYRVSWQDYKGPKITNPKPL